MVKDPGPAVSSHSVAEGMRLKRPPLPRSEMRCGRSRSTIVVSIQIACGASSDEKGILKEGEPVQLGDLQYNVLFSRFLNPDDTEDRDYLLGQAPPRSDQLYLGVFMQVLNKSKSAGTPIAPAMTITDTQDNTYYPLPSRSPYALRLGARVAPEDQAPALDSTAQEGPIGGSMVLFVIPEAATENRPLELVIPGQGGSAQVQLDI